MNDDTTLTTLAGTPKTTLVNQKQTSEFDVDIGRGNNGRNHLQNTAVGDPGWLGNPYRMTDGYRREEAVEKYREAFRDRIDDPEFREAVEDLRGKTLACYCTPKACHGEVIVEHLREGEI